MPINPTGGGGAASRGQICTDRLILTLRFVELQKTQTDTIRAFEQLKSTRRLTHTNICICKTLLVLQFDTLFLRLVPH